MLKLPLERLLPPLRLPLPSWVVRLQLSRRLLLPQRLPVVMVLVSMPWTLRRPLPVPPEQLMQPLPHLLPLHQLPLP